MQQRNDRPYAFLEPVALGVLIWWLSTERGQKFQKESGWAVGALGYGIAMIALWRESGERYVRRLAKADAKKARLN